MRHLRARDYINI